MKSKIRISDAFELSITGLKARPGRAALTALGIAFGIAAIVAVLGISASGRAALIDRLDDLGHQPHQGDARGGRVRQLRRSSNRFSRDAWQGDAG